MAIRAIFILFCVNFCSSLHLMEDEPSETLTWPPDFHLTAEKIDLKSGIIEPQELWSSSEYNRSRIDYYGGEVKKYCFWENEVQPGYVINVNPVTTEDVKNEKICVKRYGEKELELLPKPEPFEYAGEIEFQGRWVQVWEHNLVYKEKFWKEITLYTYIDDGYHVPVQMTTKTFYSKKSSLSAHVIMNYYGYNSIVEEDELDEEKQESDCDTYDITFGDDFHTNVKYLHPSNDADVELAYRSYVKHHRKEYDSEHEIEMRKSIFQQNWEMIHHHNSQNLGYKMELNQFADLADDEFALHTGLLPKGPAVGTHPFPHSDEEVADIAEELPENYDMRVEGFISPIKNQAHCGSCWAFSSTAAVEGALARSNGGRILDLSEQSLVDCAWGFGNMGCNGGDMEMAFKYLTKHGIPMEDEYGSYLEQDGLCHIDNMTTTFPVRGYSIVTKHSPEALRVTLYKYGPAAVAIHFNKKMAFYASGIFYDPECNDGHINHGVTAVGYGARDGAPYWVIKNSHGQDWGEAGYILLSAADNNCFTLNEPVYPIV